MKIIKKIEINYFRSVYSIDLKNIDDLNILIGGNDSGKSNILKSLNLFFNNKTELGQDYFFADDLTRKREQEARDTKGRATIWIKIHFYNIVNWKSLPKEFVIKKVWNRYASEPEVTYPKSLPSTAIARFLNKISFHYVPAVRGRDIFSHYLSLLHDALLEDEKAGLITSTDDLMSTLNKSTQDMSERIKEGAGIDSSIQPPRNLRVLFNALDFSTGYGDHSIPLQKRGDGIQSRHIPYILDFIAKHTNTHHIWAYEEPETSLDLGPAFELANQFKEEFSEENQIFLTTHSPAFYDLSGKNVSKWHVFQSELGGGNETRAEKVSSDDILDRKLGVAALVAGRAREAYEQVQTLENTVNKLDEKLARHEIPHVLVEGATDKRILEEAFRKTHPNTEPFCEFIDARGAPNIPPYLKSAKVVSKRFSQPIIGLFDRDQEGRKQIKNLSSGGCIEGTEFFKVSTERRIFAGLLAAPTMISQIEQDLRSNLDHKFNLPVPIEFMFPSEVIHQALDQGILELEDRIAKANDLEFPTDINLTEYYSNKLPDGCEYLAKKVKKSTKTIFSEWVCQQPSSMFNNFESVFKQLRILTNNEE